MRDGIAAFGAHTSPAATVLRLSDGGRCGPCVREPKR